MTGKPVGHDPHAHTISRFLRRRGGTIWFGCVTVVALSIGGPARGAVIMTLEQVGNNVVSTGSGTVDLAGLTFIRLSVGPAFVLPSQGTLLIGSADNEDEYGAIVGPLFGNGGKTFASSSAGDAIGVGAYNAGLGVPLGYVSGDRLSGTAMWDNTTLDSLGVVPGIYTWTWGSGADDDYLRLYAGILPPVPIPEGASGLLVGAGMLGLLCSRWRMRMSRTGPEFVRSFSR